MLDQTTCYTNTEWKKNIQESHLEFKHPQGSSDVPGY